MPNRDMTGPDGRGPMTGRGQGNCQTNPRGMKRPRKGRGRGIVGRLFGRRSRRAS